VGGEKRTAGGGVIPADSAWQPDAGLVQRFRAAEAADVPPDPAGAPRRLLARLAGILEMILAIGKDEPWQRL
jgi:hypothetical protein